MVQLTDSAATLLPAADQRYLDDFRRREPDFVGPEWLVSLRRTAIDAFAQNGLPTRKDEDWRFTPLAGITGHDFRHIDKDAFVTAEAIEPLTFNGLGGNLVVLIDGRFSVEHSIIRAGSSGLKIGSLASAIAEDSVTLRAHLAQYASVDANPFVALNTAYLSDGAVVVIPRGAIIEDTIHILSVTTGAGGPIVSHPRALILAGESSQSTIIESYACLGSGMYWTNAVSEIVCDENATIEHYKVHREGDQARHIATLQVQLARSATFSSQNITLGGLLTRNDINAVLGGEGVSCTLNGLYIASGDQIVDNHTMIDHAMPHCESHELYKGILDERARGVFNGKIFVRPDAQKTDAKQTNKTLLLSGSARIDTKPQLEIYADDVKCTHGATVGQPDEEAIFYLRSRGIGESDARSLMTYAFASDIINRVKIDRVREELDRALFSDGVLQARGANIA